MLALGALQGQVGTCQSLVTLGQATTKGDDGHSLPAVHALHLAELLERWGIARGKLLDGIVAEEALVDPAARLSVSDVERLVARAREISGEQALGLFLGLQMRVSAHGYLGFAAMAASTVREAIELAARFAPTRTTALSLHLDVEGPQAALTIDELADFGTARDVVLTTLVVGLWQIGQAVTGQALRGEAEFSLPEPTYRARLDTMGPRVRYGARSTRLVFDAAVLDLPLTMADAVAMRLAREQCERALASLGEGQLPARVRALVARHGGGFRSLEEVAAELHLSPRTLKRRLAERGVAFTTLLEEQQRDRAIALLRSPDLSLQDITDRLGYSDVANFGRAFRRWTGASPAAWRKHTARAAPAAPPGAAPAPPAADDASPPAARPHGQTRPR
jgi:AraC-like DNA-binding protein